jgi:itaconate CoA-transferase
MAEWMGYPLYYTLDGAPPPPRAGASHATIFPYGPFATGDGKSVMLGLQNEREWQVFCQTVLLQPELAADARFVTNGLRASQRAELQSIIEAAFAKLTATQVVERLEQAQIANAQVNALADVWAHPQLQARERWIEVNSPSGLLPALLPPGASDVSHVRMDAVPELGQHTQAILAELGWSLEDIEQLKTEGAI